MKLFANKKLFKKIAILLVFITLVNALIPLHMVSADADTDFGGKLFKPIFKFIAAIGDLFVRGLQSIFIGDGDIKPDNGGGYQIRYSPGVIFSNQVPGLDANLINPGPSRNSKTMMLEKKQGNMSLKDAAYHINNSFDAGMNLDAINACEPGAFDNLYWNNCDAGYFLEFHFTNGILRCETSITSDQRNEMEGLHNDMTLKLIDREEFDLYYETPYGDWDVNSEGVLKVLNELTWTFYARETSTGGARESTAAQLQATVSKWYKALRLVSLVALLSVLVYVGIRIIISSTGQEKAKYKKMIGDWVAAICILFVLNYIMAFTMDIVNKIIEVFSSSNLLNAYGVDILMSEIRNNVSSDQYSDLNTFTYLILYLVLVIYTVIFTIHYLKRLVYLAFFTMIAPLIAVTYPIDRIKDGQAQAFGTWIKEYTFNAAIPVIHIIIYSALVGSARDLATSNPLYAIVCISFLIPAEKFFKKLFGFEKASTVGQLGAAAGGALVMNAINKMGAKSGKQAAEKAGASAAPRTSGGSGYIAAPGEAPTGGGGTPPGGAPTGGGSTPPKRAPGGAASAGGTGTQGGGGMPTATAFGQSINTHNTRPVGAKGGNIAGIKNVAGRYINKNTAKGLGRLARKGIIGGAGAILGGTVGLAAGVATGDFTNALKYGAVGAGAGFSGANNLGDKAMSVGGNIKGSFQEGKLGTDEYNTRNQIKELSYDQEFNKTCKQLGLKGKDKEEAIRMFNNNGITSSEDIKKMMNIQAKTGASQNEIIAIQKIRKQADKDKLKTKEIKANLASSGLSGSDVDRAMNLIDML